MTAPSPNKTNWSTTEWVVISEKTAVIRPTQENVLAREIEYSLIIIILLI